MATSSPLRMVNHMTINDFSHLDKGYQPLWSKIITIYHMIECHENGEFCAIQSGDELL